MLDANKIAAFCATYGTPLCNIPGTTNIVYIEGMNQDGSLNQDLPDRWNDLRLLVSKGQNGWIIWHNAIATTEPGAWYTMNPISKKGCARIAFGYHEPAWAEGLHKGKQPALVQRGRVKIHRDLNRNMKRDRSELAEWAGPDAGINQHSTSASFKGKSIGKHSAGCLVEWNLLSHFIFLKFLRVDVRRKITEAEGRIYLHDSWVLPGDKFHAFN